MRRFLFLSIGLSTLAAAGPLPFLVSNALEARVPTSASFTPPTLPMPMILLTHRSPKVERRRQSY